MEEMETLRVRSGAGEFEVTDFVEEATRLLTPCLEAAAIIAAEYCKACGRSVATAFDFEYGLKFAARNVLGRQRDSFFGEEEEDDDEDDDDVVSVDEDDEAWTRYVGEDPQLRAVNEAAESWASWEPANDLERALKNSIDAVT